MLLDAYLEPFSTESPLVIHTSAHLQGSGARPAVLNAPQPKAGHEQRQLNRITERACSHTRKHMHSWHLHNRLHNQSRMSRHLTLTGPGPEELTPPSNSLVCGPDSSGVTVYRQDRNQAGHQQLGSDQLRGSEEKTSAPG